MKEEIAADKEAKCQAAEELIQKAEEEKHSWRKWMLMKRKQMP